MVEPCFGTLPWSSELHSHRGGVCKLQSKEHPSQGRGTPKSYPVWAEETTGWGSWKGCHPHSSVALEIKEGLCASKSLEYSCLMGLACRIVQRVNLQLQASKGCTACQQRDWNFVQPQWAQHLADDGDPDLNHLFTCKDTWEYFWSGVPATTQLSAPSLSCRAVLRGGQSCTSPATALARAWWWCSQLWCSPVFRTQDSVVMALFLSVVG